MIRILILVLCKSLECETRRNTSPNEQLQVDRGYEPLSSCITKQGIVKRFSELNGTFLSYFRSGSKGIHPKEMKMRRGGEGKFRVRMAIEIPFLDKVNAG